jgi:DNA-binding LacI/PurR family transcriptional regulator
MLKHRNTSPDALAYRHERIYEFANGYTMAMEEFGIKDGISVIDMPVKKEEMDDNKSWHKELRRLFSSGKRPTAIVSFLDYWLIECMQILKEFKLEVPRDISLVGCHNTQWTTRARVPLTSISLCEDEIARVAVEKVTSVQNGFGIRTIKPKLIIRESTAPCRQN